MCELQQELEQERALSLRKGREEEERREVRALKMDTTKIFYSYRKLQFATFVTSLPNVCVFMQCTLSRMYRCLLRS